MYKKVIGWLVAATGLLWGSTLNSVFAQSKFMDQYTMPDPQVWSMVKYGGQTPDLYTGTVRAEIPIYTYKDPDFEIPISLSYASNGYMPNTQANFVGLGWSLNAGGCITRRVQGIRDETSQSGAVTVKGYYDYVCSDYSTDENTLSISYQNNMMCINPDGTNLFYESEPDIFMFSFLGYSGKFVLGPSGRAIVFDTNVPSGEIVIDLSGIKLFWPDSCIKIRTADGYEYTFGDLGDYVNNTYPHYATRYSSTSEVASQSENMEKKDSWFLKEITSPNGRTVSFSYRIDNDTAIQIREPGASYSSVASASISGGNGSSVFTDLSESRSFSSESAAAWFYDRTKNMTLPISITVGNEFEIAFSYTDRIQEKGYLFGWLDTLSTPVKLSSIRAVDKVSETEILKAALNHKYSSADGNRVLMLSKVKISGLGEYQMEYYKETDVFPYLGCCAVDHWGYYNSSTSTDAHSMVPNVRLDENYVETANGREPDPAKSLTGMIKCIKYPTGGSTSYKYESHKYGKIVTRNSLTLGQFLLDSLSSERIAGGLRLKEIVDSASNSVVSRRTYRYETDNGSSTGIMMDFPRYAWMAVTDNIIGGTHYFNRYVTKTSSCPTYLLDGIYIGYSSVKEVYGDGSSKVTRFTSWKEFPDMLDQSDPVPPLINANLMKANVVYPQYCFNVTRVPNSAASLRGKVMSVDHFDSEGVLLKTEEMGYDMQWDQMEYIKSFDYTIDRQYARRTLCESPRLSSRSVIYSDGTVKTETYGYNAQNQIRSVSKTNCDNLKHSTYYFYPQDISADDRTPVEQEMVDENIITNPVYVVETTGSGTTEKIVSSLRTDFDIADLGTRTMFVKNTESAADIPSDLAASPTVLTQAGQLVYRTLFTWNEYNSMGRPCHVTGIDGVSSLVIWGYGGLYPVALLSNVTPDQVSEATHAGYVYRNIFGWSSLASSVESTFRGINGSSVTTWGWKPFVGLSKKTGPDGRTTSYSYDSYGRLETVTGPDGNIDTEFDYNIK